MKNASAPSMAYLKHALHASIAAVAFAIALPAHAQSDTYPSKVVRLVLPFPPGGSTDRIGRLVAEKLQAPLKQPVISDSRPGAGGNLGTALVAKSAPDGYTLLLCSPTLAISSSLYRNPGYDARELAPISTIATVPTIIVVHPSVPAKSLSELLALARRNPGRLNYGSGGVGSSNHLAGELLQSLAKVSVTHVPYKGTALAMQALLGGETDFIMISPTAALPMMQQGRLRALAVLRKQRVAVLPDVPTAAEAGLPGWEVNTWYGLLAPAGTPRAVIDRLNTEVVKGLGAADARETLHRVGAEPFTSSPQEFATFLASETARLGKLVRDAHIKVD